MRSRTGLAPSIKNVPIFYGFRRLAVGLNSGEHTLLLGQPLRGPLRGLGGGGCVCVEADAFTVAHVSTHNTLSKCDGRYPHWVSSYEGDRYSLIYYATSADAQDFVPPTQAFYGTVVPEGQD